MTSAINANYPVTGNPTTQSVRDNFAAAKSEISDLQKVRAIRVMSVNDSAELFQPCVTNNVLQLVTFNSVTFVNPADLSSIEFDDTNDELIYKETGWYHVDMSAHVVRKIGVGALDWFICSQIKLPSGSFSNFSGGLRVMTLDADVANHKRFISASFDYPVTVANTRVRWMQACSDVTKNCGIIGYAASAPYPSAAGIQWNTHRLGPL